MPERLVCNVSGGGRTVVNFLDRIESGALDAEIALVIADRECKAIERCAVRGLAVELIPWKKGTTPDDWASRAWPRIEETGATLVCNAGFLRLLLVPEAWEGRIMNIHPALLPKYGGKGMYGDHVHRAVLDAGDAESGCTVHYVTSEYDTGPIILQRKVPVQPDDSVDSLAARVFEVECEAYPEAVRLHGAGRLTVVDGKVEISDE
ncbi:MAG: phosphoribosylglycinamide formyltransferase [Planctomycetota bacterium]|jgi:phosphoribosylglycinamide formyltransferase-1